MLLPSLISPVIAIMVATCGTWLVYKITARVADSFKHSRFRWGQIGSASLISLAHGTNDAQKTMGVITLALIAAGAWTDTKSVPIWVRVTCATAIAAGTYLGGWRIIRTLGKGLVDIERPQGMAADSSSAAVILASSQMGFALSTTYVATGSILGTGLGRRAEVRWKVAGRMVAAWTITFPSAGAVGALMWVIGNALGGLAGPLIVVAMLVALSVWMWSRARQNVVDHTNVNREWAPAQPGHRRVRRHPEPAPERPPEPGPEPATVRRSDVIAFREARR